MCSSRITSLRSMLRLAGSPAVLAIVGMLGHGLLGYVHLALVPHVRCGHTAMRHLAGSAVATDDAHTLVGSPEVTATPHHQGEAEICWVCATVRQNAVHEQTTPGSANATYASRPFTAIEQVVAASRIWRAAPKQSPPV